MAEDLPRPFAADRTGILTGEGGAVLLLETLEHARERGARIYAEILGYAANCDAAHMVHPDAASIAACIRAAHRNAGVEPEQIDYICAHGTGTPTNDTTEVAAAREVFGGRIPPISSIKSMLGHTMGAASGFGAIACCKALEQDFLPPTANVTEADPALGDGVDCVPGTGREARLDIVQNHGFAFGGNNAITILGGFRDHGDRHSGRGRDTDGHPAALRHQRRRRVLGRPRPRRARRAAARRRRAGRGAGRRGRGRVPAPSGPGRRTAST